MRLSAKPRTLRCRVLFTCLACVSLAACAPKPEGGPTWFQEESVERGIDFEHESGQRGAGERLLFPDIMGSGAALADLDGDGDLDAYLVQGGNLLDESNPPNRLYFNDGQGRFVAADEIGAASDRGYGMGVAAGDYDNDGDVDLYVTNVGENVLLRNDGRGHFDNTAKRARVDHGGFGTAATFADLDRDGDLDLFLVNYIDWDLASERDCYQGDTRTYCPPTNYAAPAIDVLYRNDGNGTFTDVTEEAGINLAYGKHANNFRSGKPGLGLVSADFNQDGLLDLFVANDLMVDQLWLNQGDLKFEDQAALWGSDLDEHGIAKAGMGVAAGDIDDDGDPDLLVVNNKGQTDSFYRNEGDFFVDVTSRVGLGAASRRNTRFGVALVDFDNDGRLDLYYANGGIAAAATAGDDPYAEPNMLFRFADGKYVPIQPGTDVAHRKSHTSRGLAYGDVDNDGGIDLLVVNRDARPYLLINKVPERGNWIAFRAVSRQGRDAHGATISLSVAGRRLTRSIRTDGSYLASNDPRAHFGMGAARKISNVTVHWPTGEEEQFGDFQAGEYITLSEGTGR